MWVISSSFFNFGFTFIFLKVFVKISFQFLMIVSLVREISFISMVFLVAHKSQNKRLRDKVNVRNECSSFSPRADNSTP